MLACVCMCVMRVCVCVFRRQRELVSPRLFEIARSGDDEHILHVFENGDDVNPQVSQLPPFLLAMVTEYLGVA